MPTLVAALLLAGTLLGQTVREAATPLRERCEETSTELARLAEGTPVRLRVAVVNPSSACAAVSVEIDGRKLVGYVDKDALDGLDGFDEARRNAAATEFRTGTRAVAAKPWPASKQFASKSPKSPRKASGAALVPPAAPVPDFSLTSLDTPAKTVTRQSLLGKTYLLHFWASWCKPCAAQTPELRRLYDQNKDRLDVITISLDRRPEDLPWTRVLLEGGFGSQTARQLGVERLPATILVDGNGHIVARDLDPAALAGALGGSR